VAIKLTDEQNNAVASMLSYIEQESSNSEALVLSGPAGTGKTFCLSQVLSHLQDARILFTAPTNKAVRVLRSTMPDADCCTIYSALGLRMEPTGEVKVLTNSGEQRDMAPAKEAIISHRPT